MSRADHIPFAVPAVGMRKRRRCPVCGKLFMICPEAHRWTAYMPELCGDKAVCSYTCMRAVERRTGKITDEQAQVREHEEAEPEGHDATACTPEDEIFALLRKRDRLEKKLMPVTRMIGQIYDERRVEKTPKRTMNRLCDTQQAMMHELADVNRRIREARRHGRG